MGGTPETLYARVGDRFVPYQVVGDHEFDLLFVPPAKLPIDMLWDEPTVSAHLHRLASFSRLILTDLLGYGSSDPVPFDDNPAMQTWTDGLVAVLGAVGSQRTSIFATHGVAGLPAMLLAATHPERVHSLVLWSPFARFVKVPDQPFGIPEESLPRYMERFRETQGTGASINLLAPTWARDDAKRRWWARSERLGGGPGYVTAGLEHFLRTDITPVLGSIQSPTLILRRRGDRDVRSGYAEYILERIRGARMVELDGDDSVWFAGDTDPVLDEIESFVTGSRGAKPTNRVLSTVLFTDIVGSTERATELGDSTWAATLSKHDRLIERHVSAARGVVVKTTGDGVLATFDGPARAVDCACAIRDAVEDIGLSIRAGVHTGEVEMGDGDVHGIAVHIAARIMALADPREVLVSGVIPPLVLGSRLEFSDRGEHELKGVPGPWRVLAVSDS